MDFLSIDPNYGILACGCKVSSFLKPKVYKTQRQGYLCEHWESWNRLQDIDISIVEEDGISFQDSIGRYPFMSDPPI